MHFKVLDSNYFFFVNYGRTELVKSTPGPEVFRDERDAAQARHRETVTRVITCF
jgi:hypothetical protein